jgi:hypothetical protein
VEDKRLEEALEVARYRKTINIQRENLHTRIATLSTVSFNGGTFKADPATIGFVHALISMNDTEAVVVDINHVPVRISDLLALRDELRSAYHSAMNAYESGNNKLNRVRNIKTLLGD